MHKTSTAFAALLLLAACSAAARTAEPAANADAGASAAATAPIAAAPLAGAPPVESVVAPAPHVATHTVVHEAAPAAELEAISCRVAARPTANGVLVTANVRSERDISGEYEMVITKSGAGGEADINQGGPFEVRAGSSQTLGETEIGLERNARLRVMLRLTSDDGQTCTRSFRL